MWRRRRRNGLKQRQAWKECRGAGGRWGVLGSVKISGDVGRSLLLHRGKRRRQAALRTAPPWRDGTAAKKEGHGHGPTEALPCAAPARSVSQLTSSSARFIPRHAGRDKHQPQAATTSSNDKQQRRAARQPTPLISPTNTHKPHTMTGRGGGGRRVLLPPINFLFRLLQQRTTVQIWLYEQLSIRIIGTIRVRGPTVAWIPQR